MVQCKFVTFGKIGSILSAAFERADSESTKKTDNLTVLFALLRSARIKGACRTMMKLTPRA